MPRDEVLVTTTDTVVSVSPIGDLWSFVCKLKIGSHAVSRTLPLPTWTIQSSAIAAPSQQDLVAGGMSRGHGDEWQDYVMVGKRRGRGISFRGRGEARRMVAGYDVLPGTSIPTWHGLAAVSKSRDEGRATAMAVVERHVVAKGVIVINVVGVTGWGGVATSGDPPQS